MQVPYWIQVLQALATPAIAALAIVIGLMQWRTAHQRAVLDLFDKRWTVLTDLRAAVGEILREGTVTPESRRRYAIAHDRAAFLFGQKVTDYLESIYNAMGRHYVAGQRLGAQPGDEGAIDQEYNAMIEISEFFKRTNELMAPYMRMHQKAPIF